MSRQRIPSKACIVCGRSVPKHGADVYVKSPSVEPNGTFGYQPIETPDLRTIKECRRFTNKPYILSIYKTREGFVRMFRTWDGESYMNSGFFCTNRCAQDQGYASAHADIRFKWAKKP